MSVTTGAFMNISHGYEEGYLDISEGGSMANGFKGG